MNAQPPDRLDVDLHHRLGRIDLDVHLSVGCETLALIGPSGAGKSSVLRAVAGLLAPDQGHIVVGDRVLFGRRAGVNVPPEERGVGMVFQDGALFPHMTVAQNIAYGLQPRPRDRREKQQRVAAILERFTISALASAKPGEVSGGERQRVALARTVASSPDVLLLDEPLSALDAVTKARIAAELSRTLATLCLPTILVSHDFGDVAGLADRVAVMDAGRIVQTGTTEGLQRGPCNAFVAAFVGANYFAGLATRAGRMTQVDLDVGVRLFSQSDVEGRVGVIVQPWHVGLAAAGDSETGFNSLTGPIVNIALRGSRLHVAVASTPPVVADVPAQAAWVSRLSPGDVVTAKWPQALTELVPEGAAGPRA